jgi:hypothetical protein
MGPEERLLEWGKSEIPDRNGTSYDFLKHSVQFHVFGRMEIVDVVDNFVKGTLESRGINNATGTHFPVPSPPEMSTSHGSHWNFVS